MNTENTESLFREIRLDLEIIEIGLKALQGRFTTLLTTVNNLNKCIRDDYSGIVKQSQLRDKEIKELKEKLL